MNNSPKITALKVELFDLLEQASVLVQQSQHLEELKQQKLRELQAAREEDSQASLKAATETPAA